MVTVLTWRELEVLKLASEGQQNKVIALELEISEGTVKFHLANAYRKLEVYDRTAAVACALRQGLIE
jgi:two-component system, NarL family, response regulator DegU